MSVWYDCWQNPYQKIIPAFIPWKEKITIKGVNAEFENDEEKIEQVPLAGTNKNELIFEPFSNGIQSTTVKFSDIKL